MMAQITYNILSQPWKLVFCESILQENLWSGATLCLSLCHILQINTFQCLTGKQAGHFSEGISMSGKIFPMIVHLCNKNLLLLLKSP